MLILILIDVQYSQIAGFSLKGSNRQNNISSGFPHLVKIFPIRISYPYPTPPTPYFYLENPGNGAQYLFKPLNFGNSS